MGQLSPAPESLRLLHLEDNLADAELIQSLLAEQWPGCQIERVQTQDDFVAALQRAEFDLILSDFTLPGFDGLSALDLASQHRPDTPFLFLSGTIGEDNAVEALKLGATDYVIKDRMGRLLPAMRRALAEVREQRRRERAEQRLREQAELLDKARDAVCVTDLEGRVTYWNESAEQIFGWAGRATHGRSLLQLWSLPGDSAFAEAHRRVLAEGAWTGELPVTTTSGGELMLESRWTLVRDAEDRPQSILLINTDITEQKKLEKKFLRAQRLESIGTLAGGIAHDLNNVLAPILMAVELMRKQATDKNAQQHLAVLAASAQHGAALIRQVLAFARGAEGMRTELQPRFIIRDVVQMLGETLPRSIAIETDFPRDLGLVCGDATQISQVLMNLCVNARDSMPEGGRLVISAQNVAVDEALARANPGAQPGPHVLITVADTGSGIPPEILDRIFDPFFTTKTAGRGTGLGLSTTIGIVKSHGGFLQVQSEVGRGTEFLVYFPAVAAPVPLPPGQGSAPLPRGKGETILVIEDETGVREIARALLEAYGYKPVTAPDGPSGVGIYRQRIGEIQAVLTDMMMPTMQGAQVVRELRALNPDVRIVAMSGVLGEPLGVAEEPGRLVLLQKPMTGEELVRALQCVLPGAGNSGGAVP